MEVKIVGKSLSKKKKMKRMLNMENEMMCFPCQFSYKVMTIIIY